jgi:hypothetical protein
MFENFTSVTSEFSPPLMHSGKLSAFHGSELLGSEKQWLLNPHATEVKCSNIPQKN